MKILIGKGLEFTALHWPERFFNLVDSGHGLSLRISSCEHINELCQIITGLSPFSLKSKRFALPEEGELLKGSARTHSSSEQLQQHKGILRPGHIGGYW